jgi:hypothetical protein
MVFRTANSNGKRCEAFAQNAQKAFSLAERVGFEPTVRYNRTPDFESGAFDLSATFPWILWKPEAAFAALQANT